MRLFHCFLVVIVFLLVWSFASTVISYALNYANPLPKLPWKDQSVIICTGSGKMYYISYDPYMESSLMYDLPMDVYKTAAPTPIAIAVSCSDVAKYLTTNYSAQQASTVNGKLVARWV